MGGICIDADDFKYFDFFNQKQYAQGHSNCFLEIIMPVLGFFLSFSLLLLCITIKGFAKD